MNSYPGAVLITKYCNPEANTLFLTYEYTYIHYFTVTLSSITYTVSVTHIISVQMIEMSS